MQPSFIKVFFEIVLLILGAVILSSCGKPLALGNGTGGSNGFVADFSLGALEGSFASQGNGTPTPLSGTNAQSTTFNNSYAVLSGKSPNEVFNENYPQASLATANVERAIITPGGWRISNRLARPGTIASYSATLNPAALLNAVQGSASCPNGLSGSVPQSGAFDICFQANPSASAYVARVDIRVQRSDGFAVNKTYLFLVVNDLQQFQQQNPSCQIVLSAPQATMDQTVTATLTVAGPANRIVVNSSPIGFPLSTIPFPIVKDKSAIGPQTIQAMVYPSSNSFASVTCSATLNVMPSTLANQNCSSGNAQYKECSFATVKEIVEITNVNKISAASCTLNSSYGITGGKLWVDKGCRADFTFTYVPN